MTENDFDRTARLWLEDGPTEMSDRALQAALHEIHVTRQRRAWWPTLGFPSIIKVIRIAAVAGAVALAIVGFGLLSLGGGPDGPAPTPNPTPRLRTLTVPAGWDSTMGGPYFLDLGRPYRSGGVSFSIFDKVRADPCHPDQGLLNPAPGPTVGDLATALATVPGLAATRPTDVTLDGYAGKQFTLTAPASFEGCAISEDGYVIWELPLGGTNDLNPGELVQVWILDVDGERLVIHTSEMPGQTQQEQAEVQAILDSIRLAPLD